MSQDDPSPPPRMTPPDGYRPPDDGAGPPPEAPGERRLGLRILVYIVGILAFLPGLCSLLFAPMWLGEFRGDADPRALLVVFGPVAAIVFTILVLRHARRNELSARDALYLLLAVAAIAATWDSYPALNFH